MLAAGLLFAGCTLPNASLSADEAANGGSGGYTDISPIVVIEASAADIAPAQTDVTVIFQLPAGFEFNTAQIPDVTSITGSGGQPPDVTAVSLAFPSATTLEATLTSAAPATVASLIQIGGVVPLQVRPTAGTPLAAGTIVRSPTTPGTAVIASVVNGVTSFGTLAMVPGAAHAATSSLAADTATLIADGTNAALITVRATDQFTNPIAAGGESVSISADAGTLSATVDNGDGSYTATLTSSTVAGSATVSATMNGEPVGTDVTVTFVPGPPSDGQSTIVASPPVAVADGVATVTATVQAVDAYGNLVTSGGATVIVATSLGVAGPTSDRGDGTYTATISSAAPGTATISATLDGAGISSGDPIVTFVAPPPPPPAPELDPEVVLVPPPMMVNEGDLKVAVGATQSVLVPLSGGFFLSTAASDGSELELASRLGALPAGATVSVSAAADIGALAASAPPLSGETLLTAFVVSATDGGGLALEELPAPVTLAFRVAPSRVPAGAPPHELIATRWDGRTWVPLDSTAELNGDGSITVKAQTQHFSLFGIVHSPVGITGKIPSRGVALLISKGPATPVGLIAELAAGGCTARTLAVTDGGSWLIYIASAPAGVNGSFPGLVPPRAVFFVRCA